MIITFEKKTHKKHKRRDQLNQLYPLDVSKITDAFQLF